MCGIILVTKAKARKDFDTMSEKLYQVYIKQNGKSEIYGHIYGECRAKEWIDSIKEHYPYIEDVWYKEL